MSVEWSLCLSQAPISLLGRTIWVNAKATGPYRLVDALARKTEYGKHVVAQAEFGMLTPQGYNCRPISGGSGDVTPTNHSEHAHNIATDVSPWENAMSDAGYFHCSFASYSSLDDGVAFVMAFHAAGFRWGGVWDVAATLAGQTEAVIRSRLSKVPGSRVQSPPYSRIDPMHFELELTPAAVAAVDWDELIAAANEGGDEVTDADLAKIETLISNALAPVYAWIAKVNPEIEAGRQRGQADGYAHPDAPSDELKLQGLGPHEAIGWKLGSDAKKAITAQPQP